MAFTDELRERCEADWEAAVGHWFVRELAADTVAEGVLRRYLVQDHQFVDSFVALLGAAVATADRGSSRVVLARQLGVVAGPENDYFQRAFDALGVAAPDREHPTLATPTREFRALMDSTRGAGDYAGVLAVLTVTEWLYQDWAARIESPPDGEIAAEWVRLHANPEFDEWVLWLRAELDRVGADLDGDGRAAAGRLFADAVRLELEFFAACYG